MPFFLKMPFSTPRMMCISLASRPVETSRIFVSGPDTGGLFFGSPRLSRAVPPINATSNGTVSRKDKFAFFISLGSLIPANGWHRRFLDEHLLAITASELFLVDDFLRHPR